MNTSKTIHWIGICLIILLCSFAIGAQSGRRQPRVEPAAPVPTPTPEPTPKPKAQEKEPDLVVLIGADRSGNFSYFPSTYYDAVVDGCAEALRRSSASVEPSFKALNRSDAIKKAKEDGKTYVVLLELNGRAMSGNTSDSGADIEISFTVFAPGTAKVVTSGRSYQNSNRAGPVVVGPTSGSNVGLYREVLLKRAGEDAGSRIRRALHLEVPGTN